MGKPCYNHYPSSIVQSRKDHPSTLSITMPKKVVKEWDLQSGQIVESRTMAEGQDVFLKVKKITF